ncbi:MAG: hypothetical protein AAB521_01415 [Patescibacteria group bacterium]
MITIIHGDSTDESRNYFFDFKKSFPNLTSFEGTGINKDDLNNLFQGENLFFEEKNASIENFLSKNKPSKSLDEIIEILNANSKTSNIILWEEKEIGKRMLDKFPKASIQTFKIPKLIFNFLDAIAPNNGQNLVKLFHDLLKNSPIEIIIYMITRQLRILIALKDKNQSIDEISKIMSWQRSRLENQASQFTSEKLINIYEKLYSIDSSQKTGKLNMPTADAIDIFLLNI